MNQNRVKKEPYNKKFLVVEAIYYNEETPYCLISETIAPNLETMDSIYAFYINPFFHYACLCYYYPYI